MQGTTKTFHIRPTAASSAFNIEPHRRYNLPSFAPPFTFIHTSAYIPNMTTPTIDTLLRLVPDSPASVLTSLSSHPTLASTADSTGYTLLHAAASYSQLDLLRALVQTYHVPVNITDSEGETPLFATETVAAARCLVDELGADVEVCNEEGVSVLENARENVEDGGEWVAVAEYLAGRVEEGSARGNGVNGHASTEDGAAVNGANGVHAPPPLPPGVRITGMRQVAEEQDVGEAPDPEFRRRIEELAARDDFQGEEGQNELKRLVEDAIGGLRQSNGEREVRQRTE